jgi:signal peptidase I
MASSETSLCGDVTTATMTTNDTVQYTPPTLPAGGVGSHETCRGKGALAVAATLLLPGLGQILAGERSRGLRWLLAYLALSLVILATFVVHQLVPVLIVAVPLQILLQLACVIDAYRAGRRSQRRMLGSPGRRYLVAVVLVLATVFANPMFAVALPAQRFLAETFVTPAASMSPTLEPTDRFIVHKRLEPRRWDVVAFLAPDEGEGRIKFVKRLVGLPGEQVEIIDNTIHINGKPTATPPGLGPYEGRLHPGASGGRNGCEGRPIKLDADEYYLLGDNSPISGDSRYWKTGSPGHQPGTIGRGDIIGRATWIYWPPSRWRSLEPIRQ